MPLIDDCLREGGNRTDCIDNLPPDELMRFHEWEQNNRRVRQRLIGTTSGLGYKRVEQLDDGAAKDAFAEGSYQAKSDNEASRNWSKFHLDN